MFRQTAIILLIAFLSATIVAEGREVAVSQQEARHLVQISDSFGLVVCVGALVSPTHVATVANCVPGSAEHIFVIVGAPTRSGSGEKYAVKEVIRPATPGMDVAVLKLEKEVPAEKSHALGLCSKALKKGDEIEVTGYGNGGQFWGNGTDSFNRGTYAVIARNDCAKLYEGTYNTVSESSFCADEYRNIVGDVGGPAIHGAQLCGLVSGGTEGYPGIFTDIFAAKSFIETAIKA